MKNEILDFIMGNQSAEPQPEISVLESAEDRAMVLLAALEDVCTEEEFQSLVVENALSLEIYGLIPDASAVTEATKRVVAKYTKNSALSGAQTRAAFRLARANKDPMYDKYKKYRMLMFEYREKIQEKYASKAKKEARRIISGAKNTAASMNDKKGKDISSKLEKAVDKMNH